MGKALQRKRNVTFNDNVKCKILCVYSFASRQARNGYCYIESAADRIRFQKKIVEVGKVLTPVLLKKIHCKLKQ